jgi:tetratricopeptide (TPR) repeat protein
MYEEAIQAYDEAIRIDPEYQTAWNNKAIVLQALGRASETNQSSAEAEEMRS